MNTKFFSTFFFLSLIFCSTLCEQQEKSTYDILGYDSNISHIYHAPIYSTNQTAKTPVIGVLGTGEPVSQYADKFDTEKTFTVTFSFPDTGLADLPTKNPITIFKSLRSINGGQLPDATILLCTVIECYKKGHTKVHIFANSRGGGATITMLEILSNPEQHTDVWKQLGILDPEIQKSIRDMVAQGTIFLAHPILDHKKTIVQAVSHKGPKNTFLNKSVYWAMRTFLYCVTRFDHNHQMHISMIEKNIDSAKWPYSITVALAQPDEITGNDYDQYLACLAEIYPEKLTVIAGGKNHSDIQALIEFCHEQLSYNNSFAI